MNKVIQANLGGIAFTLDDDAYGALDDYLASLDGYFRDSAGHADIMHDIEARLAELFAQNLRGRSIVTAADVDAAIATLGTPEQMGATDADAPAYDEQEGHAPNHRRGARRPARQGYSRYGKRLMRDPDEKVLGGVCAGLSAYFGIDNPAWLRLAFVAAVLGAGVGVGIYVILWIVLPAARTAGDKLAMRGEPIDLDGISRQVETEARAIADNLQRWGEEVSDRDWRGEWRERGRGRWSKRPHRRSRPAARPEETPENDASAY